MVYNEEEKLDFIKNLSVSENEKQKYKKNRSSILFK